MCSDLMPIDESINSSFANLVTIFENNDLDLVISLADANAEKSLYHSSLKAIISILKAGLTLDNVSRFKDLFYSTENLTINTV